MVFYNGEKCSKEGQMFNYFRENAKIFVSLENPTIQKHRVIDSKWPIKQKTFCVLTKDIFTASSKEENSQGPPFSLRKFAFLGQSLHFYTPGTFVPSEDRSDSFGCGDTGQRRHPLSKRVLQGRRQPLRGSYGMGISLATEDVGLPKVQKIRSDTLIGLW